MTGQWGLKDKEADNGDKQEVRFAFIVVCPVQSEAELLGVSSPTPL